MLTEAQFQRKIHFPSLRLYACEQVEIKTKDKGSPKTRTFYVDFGYNLSCELAEISGYLI